MFENNYSDITFTIDAEAKFEILLQQIDGNIIGPKVVGNAIGIDSFMVLISVLIGGGLFGFMGMILGVPVFAIIYTYVNKLAVKALAGKDLNVATDDYFTLEKYDIDASTVAGRKQLMEKKLAQKQARKNRKKKTDDK